MRYPVLIYRRVLPGFRFLPEYLRTTRLTFTGISKVFGKIRFGFTLTTEYQYRSSPVVCSLHLRE